MSQIKLFGNNRTRPAAEVASHRAERPRASKLKTITVVLIILAVLEAIYFTCVYSDIPFIAKYRNIYIQTAMLTKSHHWLATAFIPSPIINEVMKNMERAQAEQIGKVSQWKPSKQDDAPEVDRQPEQTYTTTPAQPDEPDAPDEPKSDEDRFYELFWELDRDSMEAYLRGHPEALANGWDNIYINEAGLDDEGTEIQTIQGEQVLAIDVPNQILLVRIEGGSGLEAYLGVLAVAKDPSRLSVKNSSYQYAGEYAGSIAENYNGVLAMTASGFIDDGGQGNGGVIAGFAMSDGTERGEHMGWGYKRIELHEDNYFYITDAQAPISEGTTDAVEFTPALIMDGELLINDRTRFWGDYNPRTLIGQSDLGEILMLAIEGRLVGRSAGCGVIECGKVLLEHNCMQAMNLDGGASTILWYDGEYIIKCSNHNTAGRQLPNAFVYARQ